MEERLKLYPRGGERGPESLSKEIVAENLPNLGREMDTQIHKDQNISSKINPKSVYQDTLLSTGQNSKTKRILKAVKMIHYINGRPHQTSSGFLSRNIAGQTVVGIYMQNTERKKKKTCQKEYYIQRHCF